MRNGIPSLEDVAKQAGVSKSTVSKILNNRLGKGFSVKEEVRLKVIETAGKLHYRPNLIAKSLTLQSRRMIHILGGNHALSDLGNIYQTVVNQITRVMAKAGKDWDVTVDMSRHDSDASELPAWKIDGAIVLAKCTAVTMDEIVQSGIPYVVVNGACPATGSSVVPDDIGGTRIALNYLRELGHSRIAYCGPLPPYCADTRIQQGRGDFPELKDMGLEVDVLMTHSSLKDRCETYISEMEKFRLEPFVNPTNLPETAEEYLKRTVFEKGVTAILAYGHMGALNLMQAAHSLDIPVPEKISVMCFCDEYANRVMSPGLTFIDLCSKQMGKVAAELLLEQIENPTRVKPQRIVLQEKLVIRSTTAPPPIQLNEIFELTSR